MKIKLKNPLRAPEGAPAELPTGGATQPAAAATPSAAPKLALKIKPSSAPSGDPAAAPKPKRKYSKKPKVDNDGEPSQSTSSASKPKKRPLEDGENGAPAKRKPKPTMKSLALVQQSDDEEEAIVEAPPPKRPQPVRTQSVKLSIKPRAAAASSRPTATAILKVKGAGKPPVRPPGVGYDSEAEEAEVDPAIESQFVLRMPPGPDCDLLRKAIEEKTIGKSQNQGGPGVHFRFLDREGRKAIVTIQGRMYAATMVELPCVIESLKSWNKKDWVKTADICQMLLVLGRVNSEEEAKKYTRPREVEPDSHRYPHGLTPPMHRVRTRRFRPRKSYLDVERIETHTEALLHADDLAEDSKYELVDSAASSSAEESYDDEDAQGEDEDMVDAQDYAQTPAEDQMDPDDLMKMMTAGLMDEEDGVHVELNGADAMVDDLFGDGSGSKNKTSAVLEVQTPATSHDVAMHALTQHANVVIEPESAASTPAAATSPDDDDDDDGDDDDEDDDDAAERQRVEELRAQVDELEAAIKEQVATRDASQNVLYKKRVQNRIDQLIRDKEVKMSLLPQTGGED